MTRRLDTLVVRLPSRGRTGAALFVTATIGVGVAASGSLWAAGAAGVDSYVTNPLGMVALAGSAAAIAVLAVRRGAISQPVHPSGWELGVASAVLLGYLVLAAAAVTARAQGWTSEGVLVTVWGVWWMFPPAALQVLAVRMVTLRRGVAAAYGGVVVAAAVLEAALSEPQSPFTGVPPAAMEAWKTALPIDFGAALLLVVALAACAVCAWSAIRARGEERTRAIAATLCALVAPLVFIVCVGLAVARDPGGVAPATGSIAYLVVLGVGCVGGAVVAASGLSARSAGRAIVVAVGAYALAALLIAATWLTGLLAPQGTLVAAAAVVVLTVIAALSIWLTTRALTAKRGDAPPPSPTARLSALSDRECEVLALVAQGSRDSEVARVLFLSERTVEAHLRRIYLKLGQDPEPGRNRRWLAARAWIEAVRGGEKQG